MLLSAFLYFRYSISYCLHLFKNVLIYYQGIFYFDCYTARNTHNPPLATVNIIDNLHFYINHRNCIYNCSALASLGRNRADQEPVATRPWSLARRTCECSRQLFLGRIKISSSKSAPDTPLAGAADTPPAGRTASSTILSK